MSVGQEKKFKIITTRHDHKAEDDFDLGALVFPYLFVGYRFSVPRRPFLLSLRSAIAVLGIRLAALTERNRR